MRSLSAKALLAKAEPWKPLDVERTIQSILRGDTKEGFSSIVSISCSNHTYLSQWKSIEWSLATFKGVVEVVRRYEVDELKYDGRSAWILYMMLEYGTQTRSWDYFEEDQDLINTMLATLLRILVEHANYNQIFLTFRTLMNNYNLNGSQLFQIGCALLEQLPATIKDENFVALLDLAVVCIEKDSSCLAPTLKMLNYCSNFVICDWKSNFFLDQKVNTLTKAFDYCQSIPDDRLRTEVLFDTIQLIRRLATMHEKNAEHISRHSAVMNHFLALLNTEASPVTPAHLHREILATLNILTRIPHGRKTVGRRLSIPDLRRLITVCDDALATEAIVDLFFNLYEADLEYWDDAFHYMIQRNTACEAFIVDILEQAIRILTSDFPESSSSTATSTTTNGRDAIAASLIGLRLDAVARIFFRLERSVLILSDAQSFLVQKTALLRVCQRILGDDPAKFVLRHHSVIDIICFILRGTHRCWLPATFDPLDEDFIYVSSALVEQFLSVTRKKIFDHKDANSLHYLAGADTFSPIQTMIAKSSEDQDFVEQVNTQRRKKSRGNSSLGVETTLESSPTSTATTATETTTMHNTADDEGSSTKIRQTFLITVERLLQTIVGRISWLRRSVTFWELDASDVAARRVCYTLLLLRLFGCPALNDVLPDFEALRSVLFQLLVDPSLSLSSFVGIESKCLQVLSLLCLHQGGFDQSLQCYEYLTKIILTNPEMLSERRRSEYQRDQISMDGGSMSPLPGGGVGGLGGVGGSGGGGGGLRSASGSGSGLGLLGFSPPRESLLYGHSLSTTTGGGGQTQAMHIALETGNLLGVQLQLLYDAVNTLLVLSEVDRSVRRKLVASCSGLLDCLGYYTPVDPIMQRPVLHLIASFIEFAPKFEVEAEEAIVGVLIRTLNSPLHYIRYQSCNLIYHIGLESPGFVFRGLSRREVEDPVMDIISHSPFEYPRLIVSAIKAAATLVHNFNIKPVWIPSSILYHWRCYQPHLEQRPFLGVKGLALVVNLLQHAQVPYRLLYFTYTLSLSASLMYACSELTGNPNPDDMRALQELKDYLIENILPWLPLAIDFISLGKRKRRFDLLDMLPPTEAAPTAAEASSAPSSTKVAPSSSRKATAKEAAATSAPSSPSSPPGSSTGTTAPSAKALVPPTTTLDASIQSILNRLYTLAALPSSCTLSTEEHFQLFHVQQYNLWSYFSVSFSMEGYDDSSSVYGALSSIGSIRLLTPTERETLFPDANTTTTNTASTVAMAAGSATDLSEQSEHSTDEVLQSMTATSSAASSSASSANATATARGGVAPHRSVTGVSRLQKSPHSSVYRSKSMEFLTVKTIDALYAFLCMDDMYPLSTYLRYTHLFEQCQVIASVSYFMSEHFENPLVLKRGLDLLRYFADHQMQLSSIAMHSPPALIAVVRNMQDSIEVLLSFAKIILAINRTDDDFARENLMRFRVHQVLLELVLRESNAELVRICIQALLALAASDIHVREIARVELPASLAPTSKPSYGSKEPPVVLVGTGPIAPATSSTSDFTSYNDDGIATTATAAAATTTTAATSSSAKSIRRGSHQPPSSSSSSSSSSPPQPPRGSPEAVTKRSRAHSHGSDDGGSQQPYHHAARAGSITPFAMIPKPAASSSSSSSNTTTPPANGSSKKSLAGGALSPSSASSSSSSLQSTINLIDVLLYVIETQGKELRTQYYALRLLVLIENQYKAAVHQVLRRSPLANALKKSKKALKKTYIDDAIAAAQAAGGGGGDGAMMTGHANGSGRVMSRGVSTDNSAAMGKGEEIERRDVEQLLNEPIIKNDRCVIS